MGRLTTTQRRRTVQAYVARLRGTIGTQPAREPWLTTHGSAYVLEVDRENVDALRFTDLAAGARGCSSAAIRGRP